MTTVLNIPDDLLYPDDDGNPMSESTEQYRWIVVIKENLELLFIAIADVFIAADLAWYPVQVSQPPAPCQAPDVMVVFGRPKGSRRSYRQWKENNIGPQVVFEILSASNKTSEGRDAMARKFQFYEQYGVEEYYLYDPDEFRLQGWQRQGDHLVPISRMRRWVSPRLGIRFEWQPRQELVLYTPDGQPFYSFVELGQQAKQERLRADWAQQQIEQERSRAEQERSRAEQERSRAEQAEQTLQELVPQLLEMGLSVERIATMCGLPIATVQAIIDARS